MALHFEKVNESQRKIKCNDKNNMINLVLVIQYHFDFRLQFDINKKIYFPRFD